jgi:hypothetical protein
MRPVHRADNLTTFMCRLSRNLGASTSWNTKDLSRSIMGLLYLLPNISAAHNETGFERMQLLWTPWIPCESLFTAPWDNVLLCTIVIQSRAYCTLYLTSFVSACQRRNIGQDIVLELRIWRKVLKQPRIPNYRWQRWHCVLIRKYESKEELWFVFSKWMLKAVEECSVVKGIFLLFVCSAVLSVIQTVYRVLFCVNVTSFYNAISAEKQKSILCELLR